MTQETTATPEPSILKTTPPIARIVSVSGAQAIALLNKDGGPGTAVVTQRPEMGALVKIDTSHSIVLGLVSALSIPVPSMVSTEPEVRVMEVELVGELPRAQQGDIGTFKRGISVYPALGDTVSLASREELAKAYAHNESDAITIGKVQQDETIHVAIRIDDLLGKHFAILGSTGTGKSCAVALIFHEIINKNPNAHVVLLDPHGEYASSFDGISEVITPKTLNLPFWLLTFEEICEIFIGNHHETETDVEILSDLIPLAKARYGSADKLSRNQFVKRQAITDMASFSTDTPVPYRISDLIALLDENIGKLDHQGALAPFKRLKRRIEQVSRDSRYSFMFGNLTVYDTMADILAQLFRVPVNGKPVTILELGGLPSEVVNVTVSVLARMAFDFCLWSDGRIPITLVCEEAHRYVPADADLGFEPAKNAISRIAKEGRKYGVSLCVISQRPAELAPTILSQCSTIIGLRMPNERDQDILRAAISDAAASILEFLPSMGNREAIAFGEAVALPVRIKFDRLPDKLMPSSQTWQFSKEWSNDIQDEGLLEEVVNRWRMRTRANDLPVSRAIDPRQLPHDQAVQGMDEQTAEFQAGPAVQNGAPPVGEEPAMPAPTQAAIPPHQTPPVPQQPAAQPAPQPMAPPEQPTAPLAPARPPIPQAAVQQPSSPRIASAPQPPLVPAGSSSDGPVSGQSPGVAPPPTPPTGNNNRPDQSAQPEFTAPSGISFGNRRTDQ